MDTENVAPQPTPGTFLGLVQGDSSEAATGRQTVRVPRRRVFGSVNSRYSTRRAAAASFLAPQTPELVQESNFPSFPTTMERRQIVGYDELVLR